jgi:hypothetical protein
MLSIPVVIEIHIPLRPANTPQVGKVSKNVWIFFEASDLVFKHTLEVQNAQLGVFMRGGGHEFEAF